MGNEEKKNLEKELLKSQFSLRKPLVAQISKSTASQ